MTKIEWTDATWNPVVGCSPVSEGCRNCYAAKHAIRLGANPMTKDAYEGTAEMRGAGSQRRAVFTGKVVTLPGRLAQPLRWRKPRKIFVNSMSDLFHPDVPSWFIAEVWNVMRQTPQHTYQILTKRPERAARIVPRLRFDGQGGRAGRVWLTDDADKRDGYALGAGHNGCTGLPNVRLGTSVEDQPTADERIPHLLRAPPAPRTRRTTMTETTQIGRKRLRAYIAYDRTLGQHEGAVLVFAHTAREAKAVGFPEVACYFDTEWIDCAVRWLRMDCEHHRKSDEPHVVEPDGCHVCEFWYAEAPLNEEGHCPDCAHDVALDRRLEEEEASTAAGPAHTEDEE